MALVEPTKSPLQNNNTKSPQPRRRWSRSFSEINILSSPLSPPPATSRGNNGRVGGIGGLASARRHSELFSLTTPNLSLCSPPSPTSSSMSSDHHADLPVAPRHGGGCFKTTSPSCALSPKSVRFDSVSIHEHPVTLGSNPAVRDGAPIQLGWERQSETVVTVDFYDRLRMGQRRRSRKELLLPVDKRAYLLLNAGHSLNQIADATIQAQRDKTLRRESAQVQNWERFEKAVEATGKTIRKMVNYKQKTDVARTA